MKHPTPQEHDKIGHMKRDIRALNLKLAKVRAIELPEPANESEAQLVADMAQAIVRALE